VRIVTDREQFIKHFTDVEHALRAYLLAATRNLNDTDDLFQAVWIVLWNKFDQFDASRSFRSWAIGVARFEVLKWKRQRARSREVLSEEAISLLAESAEEHTQEINIHRILLRECLKRVNGLRRRVLDMKYSENMKAREIAHAVGRSVEAVEMLLVRVRRVLQSCIEQKLKTQAALSEVR